LSGAAFYLSKKRLCRFFETSVPRRTAAQNSRLAARRRRSGYFSDVHAAGKMIELFCAQRRKLCEASFGWIKGRAAQKAVK